MKEGGKERKGSVDLPQVCYPLPVKVYYPSQFTILNTIYLQSMQESYHENAVIICSYV